MFTYNILKCLRVLTSAKAQRNVDKKQDTQRERPSQDSTNNVASTSKSDTMTSSVERLNESRTVSDDNIETFLDERGRFRFSRVRAMGIRMTRDIQRNLDLMKEIENESANSKKIANTRTMLNRSEISLPVSFPSEGQSLETSHERNSESVDLNQRNEESMLKIDSSIEISFEDEGDNKCLDCDDDLFACLAAVNPVTITTDNILSRKQPSNSDSDCDWEEGIIEGKGNNFSNDFRGEITPSLEEGNVNDESEVEWEEGVCDFPKSTSSCQAESRTVSKGWLEEEADMQEAIRRSLEYAGDKEASLNMPQYENISAENVHEGIGLSEQKNNMVKKLLLEENGAKKNESFCEIVDGVEKPDNVAGITVSEAFNSSRRQSNSSVAYNSDHSRMLINKPCETYVGSCSEQSTQDASKKGNLYSKMPCAESVTPMEKEAPVIAERLLDTFSAGASLSTFPNRGSEGSSHIADAISGANTNSIRIGDKINSTEAEPIHFNDEADPAFLLKKLSTKYLTNDIDFPQKLAAENKYDNHAEEREQNKGKDPFEVNENLQFEVAEANLEEEMLILDQEYMNLGDEQRKLERNAENVSSEMFAECQVWLKVFSK